MSILNAGVSKIDITPPVGLELQGYLRDKFSCGILEKLHAKAIVLDNGKTRAALITSDLIGISKDFTELVRKAAAKKTGIKPSNIMVSAAHTHCGPVTLPKLVSRGRTDKKYLRNLKNKMVKAVWLAAQDLEPVKAGFGTGNAHFNINRRLKTAEGVVNMAPNKDGVCDHEVGVIRLDAADGHPKAIIANFTCHPTVWGGCLISPDYPGYAQKYVEEKYRRKTITLFTNGACGDVRPNITDKNGKIFKSSRASKIKQLGNILGREIIRVSEKIKPGYNTDVKTASRIIKFPLDKPPSLQELKDGIAKAKSRLRELEERRKPLINLGALKLEEELVLKWFRKTYNLVKNKKFTGWIEAEIQILNIGDSILVGLPGEIFCDIGLAIKKSFKPSKAFVVGYANDCIGYIPTAKALAEGGYEPNDSIRTFGLPARFSGKTEKVILDTVKELAGKMEKKTWKS